MKCRKIERLRVLWSYYDFDKIDVIGIQFKASFWQILYRYLIIILIYLLVEKVVRKISDTSKYLFSYTKNYRVVK